jgi:branched-chain amino acid transport system ATP-binding protein
MIRLQGLSVAFGGVRALDDVTIDIPDHIVFGLVGPNGSGKSTLLNALSGVVSADGVVEFDGQRLRLGRPRDAWRCGVARTFQTPQSYGELTCIENVLLAMTDRRLTGLTGSWMRRREMLRLEQSRWAKAYEALRMVGLEHAAHDAASSLSYGRRRFLEMARVIAMEPAIVLLDEPDAGLNDPETNQLLLLIKDTCERGSTIVVVEHKIDFLNNVCDDLAVLNQGRIIARGLPSDVWNDPVVASAYLGLV